MVWVTTTGGDDDDATVQSYRDAMREAKVPTSWQSQNTVTVTVLKSQLGSAACRMLCFKLKLRSMLHMVCRVCVTNGSRVHS